TLHQEEVGLLGCAVLLGGLGSGGLRGRREQCQHGSLPVPGGGGRVIGVRPGQLVEGAVAGSLHEREQVCADRVRHTQSLRGAAAWIISPAEHPLAATDRWAAMQTTVAATQTTVSTDVLRVQDVARAFGDLQAVAGDRKSTRLNSSHVSISYAVFCLKKKI